MIANPLISVCIPLYNAAPFLGETLDRLLAQTYTNLELIVTDNCSTDGSYEIAMQYAERDPRIRVVRNRCNVGYAANLDKVTSLARGDFMMVHCADDTAEPQAIARMVDMLRLEGVDAGNTMVLTDSYVMRADGARLHVMSRARQGYRNRRVVLNEYAPGGVDRFAGRDALADAMTHLKTVGFLGAILYPRRLYEAVEGVRNGRLYNPDKHYMYKLLGQNPDVVWLHEPLFSLRLHGDNQASLARTQAVLKQALDDYVYTFEYSTATLESLGVDRTDMQRAFVDESCLRKALWALRQGSTSAAFRHLCFALAAYPGMTLRNRKFYVAALGVLAGPLGAAAARAGHRWGIWRSRTN